MNCQQKLFTVMGNPHTPEKQRADLRVMLLKALEETFSAYGSGPVPGAECLECGEQAHLLIRPDGGYGVVWCPCGWAHEIPIDELID